MNWPLLAQNRNFGQRLGDNIGGKFQRGAQNIKNAPRNLINNIKSNFESDRSRTRQLRQERRQLENELSKLEGKIDGVQSFRTNAHHQIFGSRAYMHLLVVLGWHCQRQRSG